MTTGNQATRLTSARVWAYLKIAAALLVAAYVLSFCLINSERKADVWVLPWQSPTLSVFWVIVITAALTLLTQRLVKWLGGSFRQLRRARGGTKS